MSQPDNALPIGSRLEEYRIESILGAGGFGITYKAWDAVLETRVAIKEYFPVEWSFRAPNGIAVYASVQGRESAAEREISDYEWGLNGFLDEARVLAKIKNPYIVRINRYFRANGTAYIVMDYEDGEPLSALLQRRGALSENDLLGLLEEVLPALQAVHDHGYLHRDLKPSNLYVRSRDGCVMLIDFGAARQAIGRGSKSVTGLVTPGYSPPEQYAIRSDRYGNWTDIYALGAVLYRCITGRPPLEAAERLLEDTMRPIAETGAGRYSPRLLAVVDRCLAVRPGERFQSVAEIQADLALSDQPESALAIPGADAVKEAPGGDEPQSRTEIFIPRSVSGPGRGRAAWLLAVGSALIVVAVVAVWFASYRSLAPARQPGRLSSDPGAAGLAAKLLATAQKPPATDPGDDPENTLTEPVVVLSGRLPGGYEGGGDVDSALPALEDSEFAVDVWFQDGGVARAVGGKQPAPEPTTVAIAESRVGRLLRLASESLQANRLITPYENSALYYYEQVLNLDPGNQTAMQGLDRIVERYVVLAKQQISDLDYERAQTFISRGLVIDSENQDLLVLERKIGEPVPQQPKVMPEPVAPDPEEVRDSLLNPDSR